MIDRFRQQIISRRLDKVEDTIKELKKDLRVYRKENDKEMAKFAVSELTQLKEELQILSNEYEMIITAEGLNEDEIIEKLRQGWYLTFDGFDRWAIFAPGVDFGEHIQMTSLLRKIIVEFGHRAANIASYKLKENK